MIERAAEPYHPRPVTERFLVWTWRSLGPLGWYARLERNVWDDFIGNDNMIRKDRRWEEILWFQSKQDAENSMANAWNAESEKRERAHWAVKPNAEQLAILKTGVKNWNEWAPKHPTILVELSAAGLFGRNLGGLTSKKRISGANLGRANLRIANLRRANLNGAKFGGAILESADLSKADLSAADLSGARLRSADLSKADVGGVIWNLKEDERTV